LQHADGARLFALVRAGGEQAVVAATFSMLRALVSVSRIWSICGRAPPICASSGRIWLTSTSRRARLS
jgi:hypothetical protein